MQLPARRAGVPDLYSALLCSQCRSEGAAINVITKSGQTHTTLHIWILRDEAMNAEQKLPILSTTSMLYDSRIRASGLEFVGGPIKKDKVFAFFAIERQREHTSIANSRRRWLSLTW